MNKRIVIISSIIFIVILGIFIGLLIYRLNARKLPCLESVEWADIAVKGFADVA